MKKIKKWSIAGVCLLVGLGLSGCSYGQKVSNRIHSGYQDQDYQVSSMPKTTLHANKVSHVFSTNYNDARSDKQASRLMTDNINTWVDHYRNNADYTQTTTNAQVSDDSNDHGDEVQTVVVTLQRKK